MSTGIGARFLYALCPPHQPIVAHSWHTHGTLMAHTWHTHGTLQKMGMREEMKVMCNTLDGSMSRAQNYGKIQCAMCVRCVCDVCAMSVL